MMAALLQSLVGLAIFFGIIYAFVVAALRPVHEKLDRLLAAQDDLAMRIADLERERTDA